VKLPLKALSSVAVVAFALAAARPASAQTGKRPGQAATDPKTAEAKRLFDEGAELYGQGSYEQAIAAWEKAYELSKKPLIFESMANAYERLGQAKKAREYLARWREVAPRDEHALLDSRLKNLEARAAREEEQAAASKAEAERAALERAEREARDSKSRSSAPSSTSIPGVVLTGGGAGAVIVGVTLGVIASARRPDPETACIASGDRQICSASARDSIESSSTLATVGDIIWITGIVAAGVGVYLVVTHDPRPKTGLYLAPMVASGGGGAVLSSSF
jgi:tetratricopeptide (TPR) repeat protein